MFVTANNTKFTPHNFFNSMKNIFVVLFMAFGLSLFAENRVVSSRLFKTVTRAEFRVAMKKRHLPKSVMPSKYDVDIYDITYLTKWHDGSTIKASGLCYVPRDAKKGVSELVYHHGTRIDRGRKEKLGNEENLCVSLAMDGYQVIEPDYIGLGFGDKFHIYQHAESEGQAAVDMLFAARELDSSWHVKTDGKLFLTGYSQGGHATLATHKLIEEKYSDKLHITASSPMSGAYDMAGVQSQVMFKNYTRPHYLPYLLMGYNEVYKLLPDLNSIYKHPYDTIIAHLFDGKYSMSEIDKMLPGVPKEMIQDTFVDAFQHDPNFPLTVKLRENGLCNWKPEAPVQLCYCDSDEQVTCRNSLVAYNSMRKLGAKHVTLREAGVPFTHSRCALVAALCTKMYFDTFRHGSKYGRKGSVKQQIILAFARKKLAKNKINDSKYGDHPKKSKA